MPTFKPSKRQLDAPTEPLDPGSNDREIALFIPCHVERWQIELIDNGPGGCRIERPEQLCSVFG
jgi:hypothetical protein